MTAGFLRVDSQNDFIDKPEDKAPDGPKQAFAWIHGSVFTPSTAPNTGSQLLENGLFWTATMGTVTSQAPAASKGGGLSIATVLIPSTAIHVTKGLDYCRPGYLYFGILQDRCQH
jgi:hypothetical protein